MKRRFLLFLLVFSALGSFAQLPEANYDEAKVLPYTLPDPLKSGKRQIKTKKQWESTRRSELLKLFEENVYGEMPNYYDSLTFTTVNTDDEAMSGKARFKEVDITVFRNRESVTIKLLVFVPKSQTAPVPAFLLINNRAFELTDPTRKTKTEFWPAEEMVERGYAMATFRVGDLAPDNKDTFNNRLFKLYPEQLTKDNGMRAIGAWGWGARRVMDYFEKESDIDEKKVAVAGHSRAGKAALWVTAQDQRFALCLTNNSGSTGAALSKRNFGETVKIINDFFPHWFTTNYKKYNDNEAALPVDQHELIALCAPRAVYATSASKDLWADPTGTYLALQHALKVYALYGFKDTLPGSEPGINQPVSTSRLAYHNREGVHDLTLYDWKNLADFADKYFRRIE